MINRLLLMGGLILSVSQAVAAPTLISCPQYKLNPEMGQVYFNGSCSVAYVVPTDLGVVSHASFTPKSSGVSLCGSYFTSEKQIDKIVGEINTSNANVSVYISKKLRISESIDELMDKSDKLRDEFVSDILSYQDAKTYSDLIIEEYQEARKALTSCKRHGKQCEAEQSLVTEMRRELVFARQELSAVSKLYRPVERLLTQIDQGIDRAQDNLELLEYQNSTKLAALESAEDTLTKFLSLYASVAAGDVIFTFDLKHQDLVEQFAAKYRDLPLSWKAMPAVRAEVSILSPFDQLTTVEREQFLWPAIGSFLVGVPHPVGPGLNQSTNHTLPQEPPLDALIHSGNVLKKGQFKAGLHLNVIGACPLQVRPDYYSMVATLSPSLYFEYGLDTQFGYTAKVDRKALIEHTEVRKSKGFAFWKKRWTEIRDHRNFSSLIDISFDATSSGLLSPELKTQIIRSVLDRTAMHYMNSLGKRVPITRESLSELAASKGMSGVSAGFEGLFSKPGVNFVWKVSDVGSHDELEQSGRNYWRDVAQYYTESLQGHYLMPQAKLIAFGAK